MSDITKTDFTLYLAAHTINVYRDMISGETVLTLDDEPIELTNVEVMILVTALGGAMPPF